MSLLFAFVVLHAGGNNHNSYVNEAGKSKGSLFHSLADAVRKQFWQLVLYKRHGYITVPLLFAVNLRPFGYKIDPDEFLPLQLCYIVLLPTNNQTPYVLSSIFQFQHSFQALH